MLFSSGQGECTRKRTHFAFATHAEWKSPSSRLMLKLSPSSHCTEPSAYFTSTLNSHASTSASFIAICADHTSSSEPVRMYAKSASQLPSKSVFPHTATLSPYASGRCTRKRTTRASVCEAHESCCCCCCCPFCGWCCAVGSGGAVGASPFASANALARASASFWRARESSSRALAFSRARCVRSRAALPLLFAPPLGAYEPFIPMCDAGNTACRLTPRDCRIRGGILPLWFR
mmetsp:Transcript_11252/g.25437  ORF Transcript_11252/g.25437 Transcript_11252/m.25437 type:complete len:233 (+) Transcript_11252:658-1356(+)